MLHGDESANQVNEEDADIVENSRVARREILSTETRQVFVDSTVSCAELKRHNFQQMPCAIAGK